MRLVKEFFFVLISIALSAGFAMPAPGAGKQTPESRRASGGAAPKEVISALYKEHAIKRDLFSQTRSRNLLNRYFNRKLGDLIWNDAVRSQGEVGALDFDPLYDAQDTDIRNFAIHTSDIQNDKAAVAVTFENFGKKTKLVFDLVKSVESWKIANVRYEDGRTLLGILKVGDGVGPGPI